MDGWRLSGEWRRGINPDNIVIPDADPDAIEAAGKALKDDAADIAQAGHDIKRAWAGLEGNYITPESEELLAAVDPVADDGDEMEDKITTVGQALIDFAEEIRPLLARWKSLKADAETLAADIRETGEEWTKDEDKVDQHNQLNNDLAAVLTEYQEAERNCANAITALVEGGTRFIAANLDGSTVAGDGEVVYGLSEAPEDVATPWATPQEYDAPWWVDVGSALWDIGAGTVTDFASLLGLYHEERGWGVSSWDEWKNNIADYVSDNLAGVAYLTGFYTENGWGVDSAAQWWENFSGAWTEVGHSLVPWREWDTRPGYVITTGVINIGSIVAGVALSATGVGASVGVPLLAWRGARVLRTLSNLGDVVPNSVLRRLAPASHLHNLLHGRSPDDVTTDLGDSVDSLSLPSSHLDELDEALANADDFGSQPDRGALSPSGGTPELPASTDPRSTTPDSEAPAPSATGSADDAPRPAEGGQSSHPDRPSSQDSPAEEAAGTEDPAPAASPTDRPGTDREASPSEDSADSSTGNRTPASEERLATTGEIEEILDLLHSYVDTPDDLLRLIEASRDTELNADLPERDLVTANAGNGPGTGGASSDLSLNAHHDTPGTRGGSAGGPFDLPGAGNPDKGSGNTPFKGGNDGSAGGGTVFDGHSGRPSGNGHNGPEGGTVSGSRPQEPWDSRTANGNSDGSHIDRNGHHGSAQEDSWPRGEREEAVEQSSGQNAEDNSPQRDGDGAADQEILTPEQESLIRKAEALEEKLREGGLTDEEIAQLRGNHSRDSLDWQRIFKAMRMGEKTDGSFTLGINKKAFEILHPGATRFAFDLASNPKEFAYLYEYYIATHDENRRLISRDPNLASQFQTSSKSKNEFAAELTASSDVTSALRADLEVVQEIRPHTETARINPSLPAGELEQAVRDHAGQINMGHEFSAAYHALKHHQEILEQEATGHRVNNYFNSAERTIREGELTLMETQDNGRIKLEFTRTAVLQDNRTRTLKAIVFVGRDGSLTMATYGATR